MPPVHFFDNASTTQCIPSAADAFRRYAVDHFGNPSSAHRLGQSAARAISDARLFFADEFGVEPDQVIFTGSGSEADNLAIYGIAMPYLARIREGASPRVITSKIEHPAIKKTVESLKELGFDVQLAPVDRTGQIKRDEFLKLLTPETCVVSLMTVNNIIGSQLPTAELAQIVKQKCPEAVFHTDAIQAFGKVEMPKAGSGVDLVSLSAHKIHGPKGIGALVVLNRDLLAQKKIRPLIWGGHQEFGIRSGTQSAGLISAFHVAAKDTLAKRQDFMKKATSLRNALREDLQEKGLLSETSEKGKVLWNSPQDAVPYIVSLGVPGIPSGPLAKFLEEKGCFVSTGSACSASKAEPDHVLCAIGLSPKISTSSIRVGFCDQNEVKEIPILVSALQEGIQQLSG